MDLVSWPNDPFHLVPDISIYQYETN